MIGDIAYTFHFSDSELWEMDEYKLRYWAEQLRRIGDEYRKHNR